MTGRAPLDFGRRRRDMIDDARERDAVRERAEQERYWLKREVKALRRLSAIYAGDGS